jgi:hypothetical protein
LVFQKNVLSLYRISRNGSPTFLFIKSSVKYFIAQNRNGKAQKVAETHSAKIKSSTFAPEIIKHNINPRGFAGLQLR